MARPRNDPGDTFGRSELAVAGGMSVPNFDFLDREGLVPKGRDIKAMKRMAVIGAMHTAGAPLLVAARLASVIIEAFDQYDGEVPSGLVQFDAKLPKGEAPTVLNAEGETNDYWRHRALTRHSEIYKPGKAYRFDAMVEIVDRSFVFLRFLNGLAISRSYPAEARLPSDTAVFGWVRGWERNAEATAVNLFDELPPLNSPDHVREANQAISAFAVARENAVAVTTVNLSLAVRRALDAIVAHRAARLTKKAVQT